MSHRGDWISTFTGGKFWPLDPRAEEVKIEDVAHALSMACRFTGHVERFYSVAEHCLNVSWLVPDEHALAALLHDASEAYVADVSTPVKHSPDFREYRVIEARIQAAIYRRFGLPPEVPLEVHRVDQRIVVSEARLLFREPPDWSLGLPSVDCPTIVGLAPRDAEVLYLERFRELGGR